MRRARKRVRPGLDDKILSGWNGLMITALAKAWRRAGRAALSRGRGQGGGVPAGVDASVEGRLLASYGKGQARLTAYATDYAFFIEGLLELYQATGDYSRVTQAER